MAMGAVQAIGYAGTNAGLATPTTVETTQPIEDLILHVKNTAGSTMTVTFTDPGNTPSGSVATNPVRTVPATTGDVYYAVPASLANSAGVITVTFSTTASVTAEWLTR